MRRLVVLVSAAVLIGCGTGGPQIRTEPAGPDATLTPRMRLVRMAGLIGSRHVDPVSPPELLMRGVAALDGDALPATSTRAGSPENAGAALDDALQRFKEREPEATDSRMVEIAATAMARSLGDQSRYLSPEDVRRSSTSLPSGQPKGGVGLIVERGEPYPAILVILPGSPASELALAKGEEIRAIDGQTTAGLHLDEVIRRLQGPVESQTELTVGRRGDPSRTVRAKRQLIPMDALECRIVDGRVLYLRLRALGPRSAAQVQGFGEASGAPRKIVLDLRGNQGGLVDAAVSVADLFLDSGDILSVATRQGLVHRTASKLTSRLETVPLIVLVDASTGSGAEALAAALQDAGRAKVVGDRTAGLAEVRSVFAFKEGDAMSLVIGRLLRRSGERLTGNGVVPDVSLGSTRTMDQVSLPDQSCPGLTSVTKVGADPAVVLATRLLDSP